MMTSRIVAAAMAVVLTISGAGAETAPRIVAERLARAKAFRSDAMRQRLRAAMVVAAFDSSGTGITVRRPGGFFRLDLTTMRERPILDEVRLAAGLTRATGEAVSPGSVVPADLDYDPVRRALGMTALGRRWSIDADGRATQVAGAPTAAEGVASPDGRSRVVVRGGNLVLITEAREIALTHDGSPDRPYGTGIVTLETKLAARSDDVAGPIAVQWSADGRYVLVPRLDLRAARRLPVVEHAPRDSLYPRGYALIYPLAGDDRLPAMERYVVDVAAAVRSGRGTPRRLDVPVETVLKTQLPDSFWSGGEVRTVWTQRGFAQQRVYRADPATGAARVVVEEAVAPAIMPTATRIYPAGPVPGEFIISERSGWAQLYHVTPDAPAGGRALTRGAWEVLSAQWRGGPARELMVEGIGRERDRSPYARQLYRVGFDGGRPVLLTPEPLDHQTQVSMDGRWIIDAMSSPDQPTRVVLRDADDGSVVRELGRSDAAAFADIGKVAPEPFEGLAADGRTRLSAMIFRPADYNPKRRYPVIDALYTGPTTHSVPVRFEEARASAAQALAQIGAIVVIIDARGTSMRGQAFRLPARGNMGEVGIDDHLAMLRQMAARYPAFDLDRLGAIGGSAGGYDAARFLLRRPGVVKVAVAAAGNHDLRLDKAWWPEASLGLVDDAAWARNSNVAVAEQIAGKLLLMHGELDANVPVAASMRLADAILAGGGDVDLFVVPNAGHDLPRDLYWRKVDAYFTLHLLRDMPP